MKNKVYQFFKRENFEKRLVHILFTISCIFITLYILFFYKSFLHSDSATANLLAREQFNSLEFLPTQWVYAQDIWITMVNNLIIFTQMIFDNAYYARQSAVYIQSILMVIAMYKLLKILGITQNKLLILAILLTGISPVFMEQIFGQAGYGNIMLLNLLILYLIFKLKDSILHGQIKIKFWLISIILLLLVIILTISGIRYVGVTFLPIIISLLLVNTFNYYKEEKNKYIKHEIFLVLNVLLGVLFGLILQSKLLEKLSFNRGMTSNVFQGIDSAFDNIKLVIFGYIDVFGAIPPVNSNIISVLGAFYFYKMILFFGVCIYIPINLLFKYKEMDDKSKIFVINFWVTFIITIYVYIFGSLSVNTIATSRYFIPLIFLNIVLIGIYYELVIKFFKSNMRILFIIVWIPFFVLNIYNILETGIIKKVDGFEIKENYNMPIVDFLKEKDLKFGYGSYWNAGVNTVLSNYETEIIAINIDTIEPYYWLSSKEWYEEEYYKGPSFILLKDNEKKAIDRNKIENYLGNPKETLYFNEYEILIYDFNIAEKLPNWPSFLNDKGESITLKSSVFNSQLIDLETDDSNQIGNCSPGKCQEGYLVYGPYLNLNEGLYNITCTIGIDDILNSRLGTFDIYNGSILKMIELKSQDVIDGIYTVNLDFEISEESKNNPIEFRVYYKPESDMKISNMIVTKIQ